LFGDHSVVHPLLKQRWQRYQRDLLMVVPVGFQQTDDALLRHEWLNDTLLGGDNPRPPRQICTC
ncbi:hypothetical protein, partial [Vibrio vulnificus]|uniref:hypothetical protein n=1 Tax=Vibrio vulnificus TaxID=672 RepID=UPI00057D141F